MKNSVLSTLAFTCLAAASLTCDAVKAQTKISIEFSANLEYKIHQQEYWSTACGDLEPACILEPATTTEVADIVRILLSNNETFAVKSGGHNPNNYFSSIDNGPLISTKKLNEVILDKTKQTVRVGPGNRWDEVAIALDGTGIAVVGGRIGNVGVGGYMLGAGLSFMSTQYGWAANSVLEYTIVLANASIVAVNKDNYPDIFLALKGGGNNYGIVTSYLLQGYPQGQVWGGTLIFDANTITTTKLLAALRDFTDFYPDEKAGIIMTAERTAGTLADIWTMFLYYNGPTPPLGVFDNFTSIPVNLNTCRTQSMSELLSGNNLFVVKGSVYTIGTESTTLPTPENGREVLQAFYDKWVEISDSVALIPGMIASVAFQPIPKSLTRVAKSKGGDLLDLDDDSARIMLELNYSFLSNSDYPKVDIAMRDTYKGFQSVVTKYQGEGKLPKAHLPLFQNDCFYPQDYFGRLKPAMAALARSVRDKLDPASLWKNRTAGFKP